MKIEHKGVTITHRGSCIEISAPNGQNTFHVLIEKVNVSNPVVIDAAIDTMLNAMTNNFKHRATIALAKFLQEKKS